MVAANGRHHLPLTIHVDPPQGGLFLWLRLLAECSCLDLLPFALEAGGEFAPGTRFFPNPAEGESYLRPNFATCTPAEIDEGIRRLAQALHCCTASSSNQHGG